MKRNAKAYGIKDKNQIFLNQSNVGYIGEKKYIISAQWWHKWCDYANFGEIMESTTNIHQNYRFSQDKDNK